MTRHFAQQLSDCLTLLQTRLTESFTPAINSPQTQPPAPDGPPQQVDTDDSDSAQQTESPGSSSAQQANLVDADGVQQAEPLDDGTVQPESFDSSPVQQAFCQTAEFVLAMATACRSRPDAEAQDCQTALQTFVLETIAAYPFNWYTPSFAPWDPPSVIEFHEDGLAKFIASLQSCGVPDASHLPLPRPLTGQPDNAAAAKGATYTVYWLLCVEECQNSLPLPSSHSAVCTMTALAMTAMRKYALNLQASGHST